MGKLLTVVSIIFSLGLGIDASSITNIKKELYAIADSINKDILKYGIIRVDIENELRKNFNVEIKEITNDGNLLTYELSKDYSFFTLVNNGNKVCINQTVWANYI